MDMSGVCVCVRYCTFIYVNAGVCVPQRVYVRGHSWGSGLPPTLLQTGQLCCCLRCCLLCVPFYLTCELWGTLLPLRPIPCRNTKMTDACTIPPSFYLGLGIQTQVHSLDEAFGQFCPLSQLPSPIVFFN